MAVGTKNTMNRTHHLDNLALSHVEWVPPLLNWVIILDSSLSSIARFTKRTVRQAKLVQFSRDNPARSKVATRPEYDYTYSEVTKYAKLWK